MKQIVLRQGMGEQKFLTIKHVKTGYLFKNLKSVWQRSIENKKIFNLNKVKQFRSF